METTNKEEDLKMTEQEIVNKYSKTHTFAIGFSGGKDSTATLIYLTKVLKLENVVCCFSDTGWEADETYEYLDYIEVATGVKIHRLHAVAGQIFKKENARVPDPGKKLDMLELCKIKGRFPSSQRRFCTTELKLKPMQKWISEQSTPIINVSGIRHEESPKRANAPYFIENDEFLNVPVWLPIVTWTWKQVFDLHDKFGIEPNPLYKKELCQIAKIHPEVYDKMYEMEKDVAKSSKKGESSFFPSDTASAKYRRQRAVSCNTDYANAYDVRDWALGSPADDKTPDLFSDDDFEDISGPACNSIYGLCE